VSGCNGGTPEYNGCTREYRPHPPAMPSAIFHATAQIARCGFAPSFVGHTNEPAA